MTEVNEYDDFSQDPREAAAASAAAELAQAYVALASPQSAAPHVSGQGALSVDAKIFGLALRTLILPKGEEAAPVSIVLGPSGSLLSVAHDSARFQVRLPSCSDLTMPISFAAEYGPLGRLAALTGRGHRLDGSLRLSWDAASATLGISKDSWTIQLPANFAPIEESLGAQLDVGEAVEFDRGALRRAVNICRMFTDINSKRERQNNVRIEDGEAQASQPRGACSVRDPLLQGLSAHLSIPHAELLARALLRMRSEAVKWRSSGESLVVSDGVCALCVPTSTGREVDIRRGTEASADVSLKLRALDLFRTMLGFAALDAKSPFQKIKKPVRLEMGIDDTKLHLVATSGSRGRGEAWIETAPNDLKSPMSGPAVNMADFTAALSAFDVDVSLQLDWLRLEDEGWRGVRLRGEKDNVVIQVLLANVRT